MPRLTALVLTFALTLAGCAGGSPLDRIKVGGTSASPELTIPADFSVDKTVTRVITKGSGPALATGNVTTVDYLAYNGRTGKLFDSSFQTHRPFLITLTKSQVAIPGIYTALKGQKVGSRLIAAIPPIEGFAADRPELGLKKSDTMVFEFVVRNRLTHLAAWGKKQKAPADVPSVVMKGGRPIGFKATPTTPAVPAKSSVAVLIKGSGAKVKSGDVVIAQYEGHVYPDGKKFDSSWDRPLPAAFWLGGVVRCWQKLMPGLTVGTRAVLSCPNADAYVDAPPPGSAIKAGDSLAFVVDVLDTYAY